MEKSPDNYAIEDLLNEVEKLISGVGDADEIDEMLAERVDDKTIEIRQEDMEDLERSLGLKIDGHTEIRVSKDDMLVTADFIPPSNGGEPVELEYVEELLVSEEVKYGIDWDAVKEAVIKCNEEMVQVTGIIVARGKKPVDEIQEHLVIEENLIEEKSGIEPDSIRVDYKELSSFVMVKKGDVLASPIPKKEGVLGSTVHGELIPYKKAGIRKLKPLKNAIREGGSVVAGCDGMFKYASPNFWVNEVLVIQKDVDYRTGHIKFPGDIVIFGEIKDGFKVNCGGTLFCKKTLDASEVVCKDDLVCYRGIIGRKKGTVKAGGKISARFIENCYVEAKDSIFIKTGIMNSLIYSLNRVELEYKGIIAGGKIYAQNGVTTNQVGTASGPKTEIHCGINYRVQQKLEWIRDSNIDLSLKLKQIEEKISAGGKTVNKLLESREKLKEAIHNLNEKAQSLLPHLTRNEDAEITVKGIVYPGAYIEICHVSHIVNREMVRVNFRLDKKSGNIVIDKL